MAKNTECHGLTPGRPRRAAPTTKSGFTTVELAMVVGMTLILSTVATFGLQSFLRAYRAGADARAIASQLSLARMRASSAFTRTQLFVNADARTYQVRLDSNKDGNFDTSDVTEGGTYSLSPGVNLGFGTISTPAGEQTTISQSVDAASPVFNSRGVPGNGTLTPYAIYLTNSDNDLFYAVTVSQSGRVNVWQNTAGAWALR
jgi:Tfp pilus assembly protein FimT